MIHNNIDRVFERLNEGANVSGNDMVWDNMKKRLVFNNFLKFTPSKFNVYYLGLMICTLASGAAYKYTNILNFDFFGAGEKKEIIIEETKEDEANAVMPLPTEKEIEIEHLTDKKPDKSVVSQQKDKNTMAKVKAQKKTEKAPKEYDTTNKQQEEATQIDTEKPKKQRKEVVVIEIQDTIYKFDTVKIKK